MKSYFPFAFFQDNITNIDNAKVSIMTNALQYGTGVFAGIRGYYNKDSKELSVFRMSDHYKRFLTSLRILNVSIGYSALELETITLDIIKKNMIHTDVYIRPFAYASSLGLSPNLNKDSKFDISIYIIPIGDYLDTNKGLKACISTWRRVSDNAIPPRGKFSGAYLNSALARAEAEYHGCDEAIFLTEQGHVCEGSAENIWIVRDGVLITPAKTDETLEGITKRTLIQLANDMNISVEERTIDRSELYIADEAFFSGTGVQVAWISEIDKRMTGTGKRGPITKKLQEKYFDVVRGKDKKYGEWNIKVAF
jgi:branched-chain amino acid aminotransferase